MSEQITAPAAPMISIVILNYKRRDALVQCLDSVLRQECKNREIIVVDNHSEDGTGEFLADFSPEIKVIELPENRGAGGGRNAGIKAALGSIIITLDNDIFFDSPFELTKILKAFEERPDIHVLAFRLGDAETGELRLREWCHPRSWKEFGQQEFETMFFVEGAVAYRREVFDVAGLYYEPLFIYNEGHDLALRIMNSGFRILYCPRIRVRHLMSAETRAKARTYYLFTRNYIWIAYKDYRFAAGLRFLAPRMLMMACFTLRSGCHMAFLRGLRDGIGGLKELDSERTPISKATVRYVASLEKHRPAWIVRLARHKSQPQL